jgi:prepilin-type N-terminal cleavage/methylation domain-containing protein
MQAIDIQSRRRGFSLLELLTVMAMISVMTSFIFSAISGTVNGTGVRSASGTAAGVFEQARSYSIARGVYVYVGLDQIDSQTVLLGVSSATDGDADLSQASPLFKTVALANVELKKPSDIKSGVSLPDVAVNADGTEESDLGTLSILYRGNTIACTQVVRFAPNGQASVKQTNASRQIQFGLARSHSKDTKDVSVIQIPGLTGNVMVCLP